MGKTNFIRSKHSKRDIKVSDSFTTEQVESMCIVKNTKEAYSMGVNSVDKYREMVHVELIDHKWCYNVNSEILRCDPKLPLSKDTLYKLEMAWNGVF
jgi:GTP:adenosylcobinamide-phosphate guanylyltransferase